MRKDYKGNENKKQFQENGDDNLINFCKSCFCSQNCVYLHRVS